MKPTHVDFEEYLRSHAEAAQAKAKMDALRERIIDYLHEGGQSPRDLPYAVVLRKQNRTIRDYKNALLLTLRRFLKSATKAKAELETIESGFEMEEVEQLHVVINQEYAASA